MIKSKKLIALLMSTVFMFAGCGSEKTGTTENVTESAQVTMASGETTPGGRTREKTYKPGEHIMTSDKVKLIGRTYMDEDILWFSLSGSGVEFKFNGKTCDIMLRADSMISQSVHSPRYAIYVDGERVAENVMQEAIEKVNAVSGDTVSEHIVRVVKLSESSDSTMGIVEVVTDDDATLEPTAEKDLKIEFIGDSITCGYGVDGTLEDTYSTGNEDCTKAYAIKTANLLDADYSLVSYSGHGIISGWTGDGTIQAEQIVPPYYDKLGKSYGTFNKTLQPQNIDWDFSWKPDIVVINLGTNDASYTKGDAAKCETYCVEYVKFLETIREKNPDAKIVCTLGLMGQDLCPKVEEAVRRFTEDDGDTNTYYVELDVQQGDVVVDWHPTETSHEHAAEQMAEFIKTIL